MGAAFDQFVELSAIQPDAATLWAVVDFDVLTRGHGEIRVQTYRAFHGPISVWNELFVTIRQRLSSMPREALNEILDHTVDATKLGIVTGVDLEHGHWDIKLSVPATK
ncbi:hypothetical protein [Castellaniella caeni]|uniref:hypothetical protein n=1 Tax=Castellaniella caeni TaxID=266123 RepID=UPI001E58AF38|nr:hypothetical protein [Castellaniella caeni]